MTMQRRGRGSPAPLIAGGVVLIVAGIIGFVVCTAGAPDLFGTGSELGALRGALILASGLCVGLGAVLTMLAVVRRGRNRQL